jgi:hypothetical protein
LSASSGRLEAEDTSVPLSLVPRPQLPALPD